MFKWISLGVIGAVLLGLHLTNIYLTGVIASKNHDNTAYLVAEYKSKPGSIGATIKSKTALCVTERVGQNIPTLNQVFGEIVLYTVKNIEKDESTFYQGLLKMMSKQERAYMALVDESSPAKQKAIRQMLNDAMEKPLNLLSCVANKMKRPTTA